MFLIDRLFVVIFLKAFELLMKLIKSQIDAGTPREGMDSLTSRNISGGKKEVNICFLIESLYAEILNSK